MLACLVGVIVGFFWFNRDVVVHYLPGTAEFYAKLGQPVNVRGLEINDITYQWGRENGRPVLDVTGEIHNVSSDVRKVPTVVFVLLDDDRQELYNWASKVHADPLAAGLQLREPDFDGRAARGRKLPHVLVER